MIKETRVNPYQRILLRKIKKATTDMSGTRGQRQVYYAEWKKPIPKGCILYDSTYTTFLKRQTTNMNNRLVITTI